jgi:hypothetical protein
MMMKKPKLDRIWQTWVKIAPKKDLCRGEILPIIPNLIREKINIFSELLKERKIDWYCFLLHNSPQEPDNYYFHVRFTKTNGENFKLPDFCSQPQTEKVGNNISGIDKSLLKEEAIEEAWKILGEQSELIVKLVKIHKDKIPIQQFVQFMHFNMNMVGLGHQSRIMIKQGDTYRFSSF